MIKLFNEKPISQIFQINEQSLLKELNNYTDIETAELENFVETLTKKYMLKVPHIKLNETNVKPEMEGRSGHTFDPVYFTDPNKIYKVAVVTYSIPYVGHGELFCVQPSQFTFHSYNAWLEDKLLFFKIDTEYANINLSEEVIQKVRDQAKNIIDWIENNLNQLKADCDNYNKKLKTLIKSEIEQRIADKTKLKGLSDDLNPYK